VDAAIAVVLLRVIVVVAGSFLAARLWDAQNVIVAAPIAAVKPADEHLFALSLLTWVRIVAHVVRHRRHVVAMNRLQVVVVTQVAVVTLAAHDQAFWIGFADDERHAAIAVMTVGALAAVVVAMVLHL